MFNIRNTSKNTGKRIFYFAFILLILLTSCKSLNKKGNYFKAEPLSKKVGNIEVIVDPNVEMMMILARCADYLGFEKKLFLQNEYLDKVDEYFKQYDISKEINLISNSQLWYDLLPEYAMHLNSDDTDFDMDLSNSNFTYRDGLASGHRFYNDKENVDIIRNFRLKTKFDEFFLSNNSVYTKMIDDNINVLNECELESWLKDFYSTDNKRLCLYLTYIAGNYGIQYREANGDYTPHAVVLGNSSSTEFLFLCSHEFSHSYTRPIVAKLYENKEIRDVFQKLYESNAEIFNQNGYPSSYYVLNETFNQACANKFLEKVLSEKEMEYFNNVMVQYHKMIYVPVITEFLNQYEQNRCDYKNLDDFLPRLEEFIGKLES